eukprot:gene2165-17755_t
MHLSLFLRNLSKNSQVRQKTTTTNWGVIDILQRVKVSSVISGIFGPRNNNSLIDYEDEELEENETSKKHVYIASQKTVASIQNRAVKLLYQIKKTKTEESQLQKLNQLVHHMREYPVTRALVKREGGIQTLLSLRHQTKDDEIRMYAKAALTILGYADPVKENGIRILSLDGGGTRGVITIQILMKLEELTGQRVHEMFDLIVGTSTGALLAFLLGIQRATLEEAMCFYDRLSAEVFKKPTVFETGKLFFTHAFYDTESFVKVLRDIMGSDRCMIDTSFEEGLPKVAAVSTLVNHQVLQPYVFRNYYIPPLVPHNYLGSSRHKLWEALQASTAAPGYFEECKLGSDIHQDGGLLTNNPCALAVHESKRLWPDTPLQTVVSIGNGVYHGRSGPNTASFSSLREKLMKLVAGATDVEAMHITLEDLLPSTVYFRFNPNLSIDAFLDESDPKALDQLKVDAKNYIDKYEWKYQKAADSLLQKKSSVRHVREKLALKLAML